MQRETVNQILGIKESYKLAEVLTSRLLSDEKNELLDRFMAVGESLDHDWFTEYFQEEQGDRNALKQDFTPDCICEIVAAITGQDGIVGDICSGTGGLMLKQWQRGAEEFYCLEYSTRAIAILLFNLAIRNTKATIVHADALTQEVFGIYNLTPSKKYSEIQVSNDANAINFEVDHCIMNPPYSIKWDANKSRQGEKRFKGYELAPKSKADYAFVLDGLNRLGEEGTLVAVLPHGVLFRGSAEEKIRKQLIENNLLDMVIGVPDKMFLNTGIPVCLLVLKKGRKNKDILFIDASKEYKKVGAHNIMEQEHIETLLSVIKLRRNVERYAEVHTVDEIKENDYNLNIPRYVNTFIKEELPETLEESMSAMLELSKESLITEKKLYGMMLEMVGRTKEKQQELDKATQDLKEMIDIDESRLEQLQLYTT